MKDNNFCYRLIKERIAEIIVGELFVQWGYTVYKYGRRMLFPVLLKN